MLVFHRSIVKQSWVRRVSRVSRVQASFDVELREKEENEGEKGEEIRIIYIKVSSRSALPLLLLPLSCVHT